MPVPDHLEPHQIVARGESNEEERNGPAEEARFEATRKLQERKVHDAAGHFGQRKAELPSSRGNPIGQDRQDDDGEQITAQIGPERKIEEIERCRFSEHRIVKHVGSAKPAAADKTKHGPVVNGGSRNDEGERKQRERGNARINRIVADPPTREVDTPPMGDEQRDPGDNRSYQNGKRGVGVKSEPGVDLAHFLPPGIVDQKGSGAPCADENQKRDDGQTDAAQSGSAACGGAAAMRIPAAFDHARVHTISPPTTVATGPPRNRRPWKGELRLLELDCCASNVHSESRSNTVTSPGAPGFSVPRSRLRIRAGPEVNISTIRARPMRPGWTSSESASPSAVSSPVMPKGQRSNSCIFSLPACGA